MAINVEIARRALGKTDLMVSPIGLGVMEFAGGGGLVGLGFPVIPQQEKNATIKAALDGGINWFDTAELYGNGMSESSLAKALHAAGKRDEDVIVADKWWPSFRTAGSIRRTIDKRLRFLEGYSIGLYQVHQPRGLSSPEAEMDAMADLVKAGKIRAVGVSNFSADRMRRAHAELQKRGLPLASNQVEYSLMDRSIEANGILDTAKELGVSIIAYTPLASGLLTGKYHRDPALLQKKMFYWRGRLERGLEPSRQLIKAMEEIAGRYNATPAQVALNWLIHFQGDTVVTIPGATRPSQAAESAAAMRFRLSDQEMSLLDELSRSFR